MRKSDPSGTQKPAVHGWRREALAISLLLILGLIGWAGLGQSRRVQVGTTVQSVTDGVENASSMVRDKVAGVGASIRNLGLEQAVSASLASAKTLEADTIKVTVLDEGTVTLSGLVRDEAAKEKAAALACKTRGVLHVVDELAFPPPSRILDPSEPAVTTRPHTLK